MSLVTFSSKSLTSALNLVQNSQQYNFFDVIEPLEEFENKNLEARSQ